MWKDYYIYIIPPTGGAERELICRGRSYGEAEKRVKPYIGEGEIICRMEVALYGRDI